MRIGELSAQTHVSERALRYYEEQGLLHPTRNGNRYREYRDEDVAAVGRIRALLAAGLRTTLIAEILPCMVDDEQGPIGAACPEVLEALEAEGDRISRDIAELEQTRALLDAIIARGAPFQPLCADTEFRGW